MTPATGIWNSSLLKVRFEERTITGAWGPCLVPGSRSEKELTVGPNSWMCAEAFHYPTSATSGHGKQDEPYHGREIDRRGHMVAADSRQCHVFVHSRRDR